MASVDGLDRFIPEPPCQLASALGAAFSVGGGWLGLVQPTKSPRAERTTAESTRTFRVRRGHGRDEASGNKGMALRATDAAANAVHAACKLLLMYCSNVKKSVKTLKLNLSITILRTNRP
jgi:hypothetical protein